MAIKVRHIKDMHPSHRKARRIIDPDSIGQFLVAAVLSVAFVWLIIDIIL